MTQHITRHGRPWCEYTSHMAGLAVAKEAHVHQCTYIREADARQAQRRLAEIGVHVEIIEGPCPDRFVND